ncbi:CASP8 and FADD-like apoptosis regulator isoform X4 [Hypanus sabinus]|uniref:CASP8 and FADD-like apoptosis regulator isoform X4 n=1 Tax=Hypanus sabinus TaxID=79690 RepID=UPI0028C3C345|nr:CASP8 and FADD-like apoptosis regulator isoform X4 [Hypanus sabinus]
MFAQGDKEIRKEAMVIAAELSQEESAIIMFLCTDFVKGYSVTGEVKELFEILSKRNLLRLDLLSELLYQIRRLDILKKMKVDLMRLENNLRAGEGYVSPYRQLLVNISEDLSQEDLRSVLFLLSCQIPKGRLETVKTFLDLVVELEKCGKIDENNLAVVEECLTNIRRIDLKRKISKHKQMRECIRRSDAYQNVIPVSVPQQECGHIEQPWLSTVRPVITTRLLRQCAPSNCPRLTIALPEEPNVTELSSPVPESAQATVPRTSYVVQQNRLEAYKMQSNPFGLCLIIDCIGTDADLLKETFEALNFNVLLHLYVELNKIEKILKETSERDDLGALDCFVCCIISRGTQDCILAVDGNEPGLPFKQIQHYFKGQQCRSLVGKPRLFFVQDFLRTAANGELELPSAQSNGDLIQVDGNHCEELVPQEADVLWCCCQVSQSLLHQAPQQPSSFMRTLSEYLRKYQHKSDLISILTEVNRKTMLRNEQLNQLQATPLILQHTLRKQLIFP